MATVLPPHWTRYTTEDGKEYFHNSTTNVTQWEHPGGADLAESVYAPGLGDLDLSDSSQPLTGMGSTSIAAPEIMEAKQTQPTLPASVGAGVPRASLGSAIAGSIGGAIVSSFTAGEGSHGQPTGGFFGLYYWAMSMGKTMFDIDDEDVVKRLRLAVRYTAPGAAEGDFRQRPDFYGPFWIATTAVLFQAASGNFARLLLMRMSTEEEMRNRSFEASYSEITVAATLIYGCLVLVPLITRVALHCQGQGADSVNFKQLICVYGYSLAPLIPVCVMCLLPSQLMRWIAVVGGHIFSLAFVRGHLWTDLEVEAPSLKWSLVGVICGSQALIYFTYRVWFFAL